MQSQLQSVEIEPVRCRDYDLTVHRAVLWQSLEQGFVQIREIAIERSSIAALNVYAVCAAEHDCSEAVPFRFVEIVSCRQLIRELREHWLDRRLNRKSLRAH